MAAVIQQSPDVKNQEPIDVDTRLKEQGSPAISHSKRKIKKRQIWWSNTIFFIAFHVVALNAWYLWPSSWRTWFLYYINWHVGMLGITIGWLCTYN